MWPRRLSKDVSKRTKPAEAIDIAVRYFLYDLFDITSGVLGVWHALGGKIEDQPATVVRAVERSWIVLRELGLGEGKLVSASLTSEGRLLARKALH